MMVCVGTLQEMEGAGQEFSTGSSSAFASPFASLAAAKAKVGAKGR